ncbi:hypothetical protein EYF80_055737 [Liparis tanakae]|uniref:C-type lectin domain-containing protein n=1 Tax=Liparis tanakae TaxID=230148 RepID=A0A4Z2EYQ2_9TELE|nr:hypothetical protein EYF80_055737 [Liparis tanakae]
MTKSCFSGPFLLLFLCGAAPGLGSVVVKEYAYFQSYLTWQEAQEYCSGDLNTSTSADMGYTYSTSDVDYLMMHGYRAWIGLQWVGKEWQWVDGEALTHPLWVQQPLDSDECASIFYPNHGYYGNDCEESFFFFCNTIPGTSSDFIPESKTLAEASKHCVGLGMNLAVLPDHDHVRYAIIPRDFPVWVGVPSEEASGTEFGDWPPGETSAAGDCVAVSSLQRLLSSEPCSAPLPFVCRWDNVVLVRERMAWEAAMEHCRALGHELVSVEPGDDHDYLAGRAAPAGTEAVGRTANSSEL